MKSRLDQLLVERGLVESRTIAQALIMAGKVKAGSKRLDKPGMQVDTELEITLLETPRYVSRGGDKLASVAEELALDFIDKVVLDAGSSTGGFTDFALQHGASKVYAVDVGTNQLAFRLREDERVVVMERTDIRSVERLPELPDMAVADISFVSLTRVLPSIANLIKPGGQIVAMVKPQFEADKPTADKYRGVIKDPRVRKDILDRFETAIKPEFQIIASANSGVKGPKGNLERFYVIIAR